MKSSLAQLFLSLMILMMPATALAAVFPDVDDDHIYADGIQHLVTLEAIGGYPDGTFQPDKTINRAEFLKILMTTIIAGTGEPDQWSVSPDDQCFPDVPVDAWFAAFVCAAADATIVSGYPDGTFQPEQTINTAEAAKMLAKAFQLQSAVTNPWYRGFAEALGRKGALPIEIEGVDALITRGQMAEMIYRLDASVSGKPSHTYESLSGMSEAEPEEGEEMHSDMHSHEIEPYCGDAGCSEVQVTIEGEYRVIETNGIPNHDTGAFPNPGNPNTISAQSEEFRVPLHPQYSETATPSQVPGVALNGVFFEPGTAERYDNWSYEAIQDELNLGLDTNNAHVQPTGAYHYHSIPTALVDQLKDDEDLVQVGWAADGFPMYVSQSSTLSSSYRLKSGTRPDGPGGTYDGTFTQDFEYVAGLGDLDDCNGTEINGSYAYILTTDFPYISRCLHGTPDPSFRKGPGGGAGPTGQNAGGGGPQLGPPAGGQAGGPPQEAFSACSGKSDGNSCSFQAPHGTVTGSCGQMPEGFVCKSAGGPPPQ